MLKLAPLEYICLSRILYITIVRIIKFSMLATRPIDDRKKQPLSDQP